VLSLALWFGLHKMGTSKKSSGNSYDWHFYKKFG